jgi:HAD superfamily hydrolase (TIGR01548 family)
MKTKYDGLIFDMDGVLIDVSQSYREVIRQTASYFLKRNVLMSEVDRIKNKVGMNNDWDATYALINNPAISYDAVKSYFQILYLGDSKNIGLVDSEKLLISKQKLQLLKNKYKKLGIATGRPKKEARYMIEKNRLEGIFNCIIDMDDVEKNKPSPDQLLVVIKKLNLKQTVYIGDSPSDVFAAEATGIPSFYVGKQNIGTIRFQTILKVIQYLL